MPIDPSVSLNAKPVDGMSQLKDLLGVASGAQKYQSDQLALTKARALLQPEIDKGVADSRTAVAGANVAEGTQQAKITKENVAAQSDTLDYKNKEWGITNDALNAIEQDPSVVEGKDPSAMKKAISQQALSAIQRGVDPEHAMELAHQYMSAAEQNPSGFRNFVANHRQAAIGAAGQTAQTEVPAGQREAIGTDQYGNPVVQSKDRFGEVQQQKGLPGSGYTPPESLPPGDAAQIPVYAQFRKSTNDAAASVPTTHFNNHQIIGLLDRSGMPVAGSGSGWLGKMLGGVGLQSSNDYATDYNQLNHYLSLQTQNNEKAMGVSTDAGRSTAGAATGNTAMDAKSLKRATLVNDATATGVDMFNRGMENAIKKHGGNPLAARDFQNQWTQSYDVNAMRYYNAAKAGDKEELGRILQDVGGPGSSGAKALKQKLHDLDVLIDSGGK